LNLIIKIFKNFELKYRLLYFSLFLVGLIKYFLELLSLGSLLPLITIISNGDDFSNTKFGAPLSNFIENLGYNLDNQTLINLILFSFLCLFFFRTVFGIFFIYYENTVKAKLLVNAQTKFLDYFSNSDDSNEETNNFSSFFRTATKDIDRMINFISCHFQAFLEILFLISILFILSKVSLDITLISSAILFFLILLTLSLTKSSLKKIAKKRQYFEKKTTEIIQNIFISSKLIRLLNRQKFFKNNLIYYFKNKNFFINKKILLTNSPKFIIEFLIIICFVILLYYFNNILNINEKQSFIPTMGFFLVCILRLSPLIYSLSNFFQDRVILKNSTILILNFYDEGGKLKKLKKNKINDHLISNFNIFKFEKVNFSYENQKIFKNLNFEIHKGQKIGFKSKSGSGKSTFISLMLGMIKPNEGKILIDSKNYFHTSQVSKNFFGYVPQVSFYFDTTIIENIAFGEKIEKIDYNKIDKIYKITGINEENFGKKFENKLLGENGSNFSGGQLQRISIARSLYYEPKILILDEATSEMDKISEEKLFFEIIKNFEKLTLIIVSHNFSSIVGYLDLFEIQKLKINKII